MNAGDLTDVNTFFTQAGDDVWKLVSFYTGPTGPSCTMENLDTGELLNFGMDALTAAGFRKINMTKELDDAS